MPLGETISPRFALQCRNQPPLSMDKLRLSRSQDRNGANMSLRALSTRATWRDTQAAPESAIEAASAPPVVVDDDESPGGSGAELQKAQGALTESIPTEVLGPYTALVAIIVANATSADTYAELRWWTFAVSLVFIVIYVMASYFRIPNRKRKLPFAELLAALLAFAAWGLAMPGSPLTLSIHGSQFAIASAMIAIGGAALLGLLSLPLNSKAKKAG
jgi:hypothetical protein